MEKVDVAVCETHSGGEFDATNVIKAPIVTAITSIAMDHVKLLGPTIEDIAWHKAGIFKFGSSLFDTSRKCSHRSTPAASNGKRRCGKFCWHRSCPSCKGSLEAKISKDKLLFGSRGSPRLALDKGTSGACHHTYSYSRYRSILLARTVSTDS